MSAGGPISERPSLFAELPWDAATALGSWLAPTGSEREGALERRAIETAATATRPFAAALRLAPDRERRRFELLLAWTLALLDTAREGDPAVARAERLNRAAFHLARALAGEPTESAFLGLLAAESHRRSFGRPALDGLFAAARRVLAAPRPVTATESEVRCQEVATAFLEALFGAPPSAAAGDAGAGLLRLARLADLAAAHAAGRSPLPADELAEPLRYRSDDEVAAAVTAESQRLHPLLLRGARAIAEVPLSFRRPLVFALPLSLELVGAIEERPHELARRPPRLSVWSRHRAYWRARFAPLG